MLQFPTLPSRLKCSRINSEDVNTFKNIFDSFPIHSVNLLMPNVNSSFTEKFEDVFLRDKNIYFRVKDVAVTSLIQYDFIENFVRAGLVLGVSQNARIGVDNFISIISPGKLVLSLEKSVAQCLALQKENFPKNKRGKNLFQTIIIDLTDTELLPGKKLYKFISSELSKIDNIKFDLLLSWKPNGNVCVQSLKSYFISQGLECVTFKPKYEYSDRCSVPAPKINFDVSDSDVIENVLEWIGMQICGIEYSQDQDDYASKLTVPECSETLQRLHKCSFTGFYSKADILSAIQMTRQIFEKDSSLPYIVMCISGYQDSYVVANGFQHFSSEDKQVCLVIFPSSKYWVVTLNSW